MAKNSEIQWTDHTWNPWHGCKKVSAGCKYCYMFRGKNMYGQNPTNVVRGKTTFRDPLKLKEPAKVFTCSWSDFFIEEADAWRNDAWDIIKKTPHLTYQILTKRPERIIDNLPNDWENGYENIWLGTSIESSKVKQRLKELHQVKTIASKFLTFISAEPLLSPINFLDSEHGDDFRKLDWVIIGGESGNDNGLYKYRECQLEWIESIIEQCKTANIPVFVKQLGTSLAKKIGLKDRHGGLIEEFPSHLQIRQFPNAITSNTSK